MFLLIDRPLRRACLPEGERKGGELRKRSKTHEEGELMALSIVVTFDR